MPKYVARIRTGSNSYRYFYTPQEYQAYVKGGRQVSTGSIDGIHEVKKEGKTYGRGASAAITTAATIAAKKAKENAAATASRLSTAIGKNEAVKKVRKYVYNKNAANKLNEMGKAHELDERSRQNAQKKATPGSKRSGLDMRSTINRRVTEAVYGGQIDKSKNRGEGYRHKYVGTVPNTTESHVSTPNVGKMTDAATKALQDQQRQKDKKKAYEAKKKKEAYEKNSAGKAGDAEALAESIKQKHAKTQTSVPYEKNSAGKAADAATKAKEAKARQTQQHMNKALDDRGAEVEMEVRRRRYNERQLGIKDEPKYHKPSSSELLAEFNKKQDKKKTAKKIAEGVANGEKRAEGYAQEAAYKQKRDESRRNMKEWNYEKSKVVSVKDTEERMKKKKYVK